MESTFVMAEDATLKIVENEVATVLIHQKKLLRVRNRLRSPLLRLPTEAIIRILSYIMGALEKPRVWQAIFSTCHRVYRIMRTATELWWKVDCTRGTAAYIAFLRAKGNPRVIIADLQPWGSRRNKSIREALDYWRDERLFHGHRLDTLELCGNPSDVPRFCWIFEQPLPRLRHLKIHFFGPLADDEDQSQLPIPSPVALQLPIDLSLQTLDLHNATLPWSSNLFTGLRELRMNFRDCETVVDISADELIGVFDASPQLESLSLVQVRPRIPGRGGGPPYAPTRIAQLPGLALLKLDNPPESVGYILIHMDIPAIISLDIRSHALPSEMPQSLRLFFPNHLPGRLFLNPPVFEIHFFTDDDDIGGDDDEPLDAMHLTIGNFEMRLNFDADLEETVRDAIVAYITPMVPPSVGILKLTNSNLDEQEWREFLGSHPEVRSIEYRSRYGECTSKSLWDALSPAGTDGIPLCPKLESISLFEHPGFAPSLLNCLLNRKNAGFRLRYLKLGKLEDRFVEQFLLSVEEFQVSKLPYDPFESQLVRSTPTDELGSRVLTTTLSGNTVAT